MTTATPQQALQSIIRQARLSPRHYWLWLVSTGGTFIDGYTTLMTGVAFPLLKAQEHPGAIIIGLLGAALVAGAVLGASLGGAMADRYGRKIIYLADMTLLAGAALMLALSWNHASAIACQFLVGVGIGMDFPVSSTYVSELMPTKGRSRMLTATIAFQAVGQLVAALAAWLIIRQVDSETAWRFLVGSTAIPAIITLVVRLSVPESPHWLMERGRNRQAAAIIGELIPVQRSLAQSLATQAGTLQDSQVSHQPPANYSELFSTSYLRTTILTAGAWFFMDIATYGVGLFTPVILTSLTGIQASAHGFNLMAQEFQSIQGTGLIDTFLLVGFLLGIWLVPKYGPIRMQIAGFGGMALSMVILTFASTLPADNSHRVELIFLSFILFNLTMNAGPNSTTFLLPAQLFPTRLRGSGSGLAAASGKVGATLGIFFLPVIKDAYGTTLVLALMVVVSTMGYFITLIFSRKLARQARYGTQTSTP